MTGVVLSTSRRITLLPTYLRLTEFEDNVWRPVCLNIRFLAALAAMTSLILVACGGDGPKDDVVLRSADTPTPSNTVERPHPTATSESPDDKEWDTSCVFGETHFGLSNTPTLKERFAIAERSARVLLKEVRTAVPTEIGSWEVGGWADIGSIKFDLKVIEWLSGDGPDEFAAYVSAGIDCKFSHQDEQDQRTEREAALKALSRELKTMWYNAGEAILFLEGKTGPPYEIGYLGQINNYGRESFGFSEPRYFWNVGLGAVGGWLPKVPGEDRYQVHTVRSGEDYTVSMEEIREAAAQIAAEVDRGDDEEYRECVRNKYLEQKHERLNAGPKMKPPRSCGEGAQ